MALAECPAFGPKDLPVLKDMVKLCQRLQLSGTEGVWRDFVEKHAAVPKKLRGRRDPKLHSWASLAAFIGTLKGQELTKVLVKFSSTDSPAQGTVVESSAAVEVASTGNRGGAADVSGRDAWSLVARTKAHPKFARSYQLPSNADGWVVVRRPQPDCGSEPRLVALDCEMCESTESQKELVRVALVDAEGHALLDELVKPQAQVLDYREEYTGITAETLKEVTYTRADAQAAMLRHLEGNVVLVGHALPNDFEALRLIFQPVIDTSYAFKYRGLNNCSPALADLHETVLKKALREEGKPHDCRADAAAAMALVQYELQNGPCPELPPPPVKVGKDDLKKLLVHSVPPGVTPDDLLALFAAAEGVPEVDSPVGDLEKDHKAFIVFENPAHADEAFRALPSTGEGRDSRGRAQKQVTLQQGLRAGKTVKVRKMAAHNGLAFGADACQKRDRSAAEVAYAKKRRTK